MIRDSSLTDCSSIGLPASQLVDRVSMLPDFEAELHAHAPDYTQDRDASIWIPLTLTQDWGMVTPAQWGLTRRFRTRVVTGKNPYR